MYGWVFHCRTLGLVPTLTYVTKSHWNLAYLRGGATGGGGGGGGGRSGFGRTNLNTELIKYIYTSFLNPKEVAVYVQCITT